MLSLDKNHLEIAQQLLKHKAKLEAFSHQSIEQSVTKRDEYQTHCHSFLRTLTICPARGTVFFQPLDSLKGKVKNANTKDWLTSGIVSALIGEFFVCAGSALLDGELRYWGVKIINSVDEFYFNSAQNFYSNYESSYSYSELPLLLAKSLLLESLSPDAFKLLVRWVDSDELALTTEASNLTSILCVFRRSLKAAAAKAGLEFKYAQILELEITELIKQLTSERFNQLKSKIHSHSTGNSTDCNNELDIWLTAHMIELQSQMRDIQFEVGEVNYVNLLSQLKRVGPGSVQAIKLSENTSIKMYFALLMSTQVNQDLALLRSIYLYLIDTQSAIKLDQLASYSVILLARICKVLRQLPIEEFNFKHLEKVSEILDDLLKARADEYNEALKQLSEMKVKACDESALSYIRKTSKFDAAFEAQLYIDRQSII